MIAGFIRPWTETEWEILNLMSVGDVVTVERAPDPGAQSGMW